MITVSIKLRKALLNSVFDPEDFNAQQIEELELGLQDNETVTYLNPFISAENMRNIRVNNIVKLNIRLA